ncbi:hypothetical protein GGTG_13353 [Gaeumannomyces tritici R3-111a-1]|uniref:Uncharacterized protein n=1 Tax=Gaeumannomyces tritici (strain R3-111a-1) TaxID=644352 RepID=J3PIM4_GAET3|nr:hypothetical protein GGTG_13353 [Gaeumannomyces tritici R3-111a-1]EJT69085.1 hypothetical protein GGTG_13353 [Gaeumannomyces tritici R3-111a-1]
MSGGSDTPVAKMHSINEVHVRDPGSLRLPPEGPEVTPVPEDILCKKPDFRVRWWEA